MDILTPTVVIYLLIGAGVAIAVFLSGASPRPLYRWFGIVTALPFWPFYVPVLLARPPAGPDERPATPAVPPADEMAAAIRQVDEELEAALSSLDGWAEDVLAREKDRIHELRSAWTAQAKRIREMDRLLALPEYAGDGPAFAGPLSTAADERLRRSRDVRRQNVERLRAVRQRAYDDLMGTLAWVRELVSMIHLAKFTGEPASRAEELVAQIAAAVEGISELTWREDDPAASAGST
jgi:hypothetical protein